MPVRNYPPPAVVREILANRYFLARVYRFVGGLDLEAALGITDESFQSYDALRHEHGDKPSSGDADATYDGDDDKEDDDDEEEEDDIPDFDELAKRGGSDDDDDDDDEEDDDDDDEASDDLVDQRLTLPLYLPRGFVWEIEHFDNGEETGIVHRIRAPGEEPVRFATLDAHPTGHALGWSEAERLVQALQIDPRNRVAHVSSLAPLLLWSAIGLGDTDDREVVRVRLAEAWRQSGMVTPEVADQLALDSSRRRSSSFPQSAPIEAFAQLLAALAKA